MTDADSICESKLSRLQDPNLQKMKPLLVDLMGEMRERRQERAEPRSHASGAQEATQHQQAQRPTEGVEHDASTLREWSGDVEVRRSWWRRWFGG
jgi:hypothetical protein